MKSGSVISRIMVRIVALVGLLNRALVRIPGIGKKMVSVTSSSLGKIAPYLGLLGFRKDPSYDNAIWNWEIFLDLVGAEYEKETVSAGKTIYTIHRCPAGYCNPNHLDACEATMELDSNLVRKSGAELIVEKRIPIDGVCVEVVVSTEEIE